MHVRFPPAFNFPASGDRRTLTIHFILPQAVPSGADYCSLKINAYRRVNLMPFSCPCPCPCPLSVTVTVNSPRYFARDCLMSSTAMVFWRSSRRLPTPLIPSPLIPTPLIDDISYRSCASTRRFSQTPLRRATVDLDALDASKGNRERIVILGSGWAGRLTVQGTSLD